MLKIEVRVGGDGKIYFGACLAPPSSAAGSIISVAQFNSLRADNGAAADVGGRGRLESRTRIKKDEI